MKFTLMLLLSLFTITGVQAQAITNLLEQINNQVHNGKLEDLEQHHRRDIKMHLNTILDILIHDSGSFELFCVRNPQSSRSYILTNGRNYIGKEYYYQYQCEDAKNEVDQNYLLCAQNENSSFNIYFNIYNVKSARVIGASFNKKSQCNKIKKKIYKRKYLCLENNQGKFQIFNIKNAKTIGGEYNRKLQCENALK